MSRNKVIIILVICTVLLSASAAFFSVYGLSKLFAGASIAVIIMASVLELSKLVIAFVIHQENNNIPTLIKTYLSIAVIILMVITSAGIYGFLSNAYQITANKNLVFGKQVEILEVQSTNLKSKLEIYNKEKESIIGDIAELRTGLTSGTKVEYIDKSGQKISTTSSKSRSVFEKQLEDAVNRREEVTKKADEILTKIDSIEILILETNTNNEAAAELGPLMYLSRLTGASMDKIINYFILMIIFVFDPLAVCSVITISYLLRPVATIKRRTRTIKKPVENKPTVRKRRARKPTVEKKTEEEPKPVAYQAKVQVNATPKEKIVDNGQISRYVDTEETLLVEPLFNIKDHKQEDGYSLLTPDEFNSMSDSEIKEWYKNK